MKNNGHRKNRQRIRRRLINSLLVFMMIAGSLTTGSKEIHAATGSPAVNEGSAVLSEGINTDRAHAPLVKFAESDWYVIGYNGLSGVFEI